MTTQVQTYACHPLKAVVGCQPWRRCAQPWWGRGSSAGCTPGRPAWPEPAGGRGRVVAGQGPGRGRGSGADQAFASGEELVEADGIDVVHICTPNHLHEPLALKALAAGKHVVLEKPVALDGAGAAGGRRRGESGQVVAVPFAYRFNPMIREARARVAAGEPGPLRLLTGGYQQDWLLTPDDVNWRVDAALGGPSRAFADIGSHWCDLVEFVSGDRIARLLARTVTAVPERAAVSSPVAFSPPAEGGGERRPSTRRTPPSCCSRRPAALGSMLVSQISAGRKNHLWFELDGEQASVFDQEQAETLWLGRRTAPRPSSGTPPTWRPTPPACRGCRRARPGLRRLLRPVRGRRLRRHRRAGAPGLPLIGDGVRAARITDAVLASAAPAPGPR